MWQKKRLFLPDKLWLDVWLGLVRLMASKWLTKCKLLHCSRKMQCRQCGQCRTSIPAPPRCPDSSAAASASSSTSPPRAILMKYAPRFIAANCCKTNTRPCSHKLAAPLMAATVNSTITVTHGGSMSDLRWAHHLPREFRKVGVHRHHIAGGQQLVERHPLWLWV